jgi:hypothetical protein
MTQPSLNRRLTTIDSTFLYLEKAEQPMHIGGCMLYEGRVSREELARLLLDRLHRLPRYRQKVVFPPFTLAHPTWEDDPDFDIAHHIDEVTLPAPPTTARWPRSAAVCTGACWIAATRSGS